MTWLNYHHLLYFWKVAKEGSIARASVDLRLAPPTISVQIHQLEEVLGQKLFERHGRGLLLTDVGRVVFHYAENIFTTGDALLQAVGADTARRRIHVNVGVADTLPRIVVERLLRPMFAMAPEVAVTVSRERSREGFPGDLAAGAIEVVVSDMPLPRSSGLRASTLPLGACGTAFLATPKLAHALSGPFPRCLDAAPCVFPGHSAALRHALEDWCEAKGILMRIVADMDDAALALEVAAAGVGVIAVPDVAEVELVRQRGFVCLGRAPDLPQAFFAWSLEQEPHQAAVAAMLEGARERLLGTPAIA